MRLIPIITLAALFGFTGCGISVDGLGSVISDAECVIDQSKCADSTDTTDSEGTDSAETGTTASDGTNSSDPETGGGIMSETYDRVDGAFFMGTYQSMDFHTDYYDVAGQCSYNFPGIIRGYSHEDIIDFEKQSGELAFAARIYPDETFDFEARFQNSVGQPTVQVTCTCEINLGYEDYFPNEIHCGCTSTEDDSICLRYWSEM